MTSRENASASLSTLAIFDLDRTLSRIPTYTPFLLFAAMAERPFAFLQLPKIVPDILLYAMGRLDRKCFKQVMHRAALGNRLSAEKAQLLVNNFARRLLENHVYPQAHQQLLAERSGGSAVWIATAAPQLYAQIIGDRLSVDHVVATRNVWAGNCLTPLIDGENCYGEAKLRAICAALRKWNIDRDRTRVRFYSDDISDLPTFEWADEPIAVNPSRGLRRIATAREWPILDWRHTTTAPRVAS